MRQTIEAQRYQNHILQAYRAPGSGRWCFWPLPRPESFGMNAASVQVGCWNSTVRDLFPCFSPLSRLHTKSKRSQAVIHTNIASHQPEGTGLPQRNTCSCAAVLLALSSPLPKYCWCWCRRTPSQASWQNMGRLFLTALGDGLKGAQWRIGTFQPTQNPTKWDPKRWANFWTQNPTSSKVWPKMPRNPKIDKNDRKCLTQKSAQSLKSWSLTACAPKRASTWWVSASQNRTKWYKMYSEKAVLLTCRGQDCSNLRSWALSLLSICWPFLSFFRTTLLNCLDQLSRNLSEHLPQSDHSKTTTHRSQISQSPGSEHFSSSLLVHGPSCHINPATSPSVNVAKRCQELEIFSQESQTSTSLVGVQKPDMCLNVVEDLFSGQKHKPARSGINMCPLWESHHSQLSQMELLLLHPRYRAVNLTTVSAARYSSTAQQILLWNNQAFFQFLQTKTNLDQLDSHETATSSWAVLK